MTPDQIKSLKRYWWIIVLTPIIAGMIGHSISPTATAEADGTSQNENIISFTLGGIVLGIFIVCIICQPSDVSRTEIKQSCEIPVPERISMTLKVFLFCILCLVVTALIWLLGKMVS